MNKARAALPYLAARMKEASSYSGAAMMVLAAAHVNANPGVVSAALAVVASVGGLVAVLVPAAPAASQVTG